MKATFEVNELKSEHCVGQQCYDCAVLGPKPNGAICETDACLGRQVERLSKSRQYWEAVIARRSIRQSSSNYCVACRRLFPDCGAFLLHIRQQHLCTKRRRATVDPKNSSPNKHFSAEVQQFSATELRYYVAAVMLSTAEGSYSCDDCETGAMTASDFARHIQLLHLGLDVWTAINPGWKTGSCVRCSSSFDNTLELNLHLARCCEDTETMPVNLLVITKKVDDSWCLPIGDDNGASQELDKVAEQEASQHAAHPDHSDTLTKTLSNSRSMKVHRKHVGATNKDGGQPSGPVSNQPSLETDKKYVCQLCGKAFVRHRGLRQHIDTFHLQAKNYSCNQCGKQFGRKDSLDKHGAVHTDQRRLVCEFCSRSFSQSANLLKHRQLMHLEMPRRHACSLCSGRYWSPGELATHVRISHQGVKDHRCLVCGQVFGGRPIVRRHVRRVHKLADPIGGEHFVKLDDPLISVTVTAEEEANIDEPEGNS